MNLVERATQLDELCAALGRAGQGHGLSVLLSGEAGVGKTSLLKAFTDRIGAKARVFEGRCDELSTPRTLGPFRDIARDCGGRLGDAAIDDRDSFIDALVAEMGFAQRPAVVIVEDAHWADHASLDIIRYLARRMATLPALLVVSYRDDELSDDHPLRLVIGSLAGTAVLRMPLVGLSDESVAELARAAGLAPDTIVATVGGNPFYLSEVLAEPVAAVPASVRDAVLARVLSLPVACRLALEQLAVVPTEVETSLLTALVDVPAALEPAERRAMVTIGYHGLRFRHDIARRVIEMSMSRSRQAAAHRRVLEALVAAGAESSRLVHHALGAGDEDAVARFAFSAATEAAHAKSHAEAMAFARLVLDRGDNLSSTERATLHGIAASALHDLNRFPEAAAHADEAVKAWHEAGTAPAGLAEALLISARMSTLLADPASARAKSVRAVEILTPLGPSRMLALAYSTIASRDTLLGEFEDAEMWSERALSMAARVGSDDVLAHALGYRGVAKATLGDASGMDDLKEAVAAALRLDLADYVTVSAHNLSVMLVRGGRLAEAKEYLDIAERVAAENRLGAARYRIEGQQCHLVMLQGSWDEAERRLRRLLDTADDAGANAVNPLCFLGRIRARRGDPVAADFIARAWDLAAACGEDQKRSIAAGARMELNWLTGDLAAVQATGAELLPVAIRTRHHLVRGEVLRYLRRAGVDVAPFPECPAPFAAGIAGDWERAARLWEEEGNPYERALELSESPDPTTVTVALEILDRLGAVATAAIIRRRLRSAGVAGVPRGPRSTTRANPGRLTDRQLEILALLDAGCTNSEIAERLFLSTRTVDNHVAALLRRLGVTSRREAGAVAARAGLLRRDGEPG
ncbi:MAG TPA: AAA family ATPase [Micromonosporaceae bacterium]|nr:AAA family ATPase [Micromonosporaceae bacterium]